MPNKILLVDDDAGFRSELCDYLEGYETLQAPSGEEALKILKRANDIDVVVLDVMMPRVNGLDVLTEIKKNDPDMGIIIMTGFGSKDVAVEALKGHADDYIEKPTQVSGLRESIEKVLAAKRCEDPATETGIPGKIEQVKSFIERNCFKKISLNDAAQSVYLSPKYLSKIFKQHAKVGFSEFKLKIKIDKAKELLLKSALNINQISDKLGYENPESFIRQFRKFTQCTPTEYRKKMRKPKKTARLSRKKAKKTKR
jgi:two-component system response regulator YesN